MLGSYLEMSGDFILPKLCEPCLNRNLQIYLPSTIVVLIEQ